MRAGSHGYGHHDLVADALLAAQAPLIESGQLGNPESLFGLVCSRGRGGDSPCSRVGAVAGANVVNQPHEQGRPAGGVHECHVAYGRPIDRGRHRDVVHPND